jgi:hypothetical protein
VVTAQRWRLPRRRCRGRRSRSPKPTSISTSAATRRLKKCCKEALQKNPANEEGATQTAADLRRAQRQGRVRKVAKNLHAQTGGSGDIWLKAAAMGFALDAANSLYEAGRSAPVAAAPIAGGAPGTDLDFDFDLGADRSRREDRRRI